MNKTTSRNFSNRWSDPYNLSRGPTNSIVSTPNVNNIGQQLRSRASYQNQSAVPVLMVKKPAPHHQQEILVSSSHSPSSLSSSTSAKLTSSKIRSTSTVNITSTIKKTRSTIITTKKSTTSINKMTPSSGGSSTVTTITTHPTRLPLVKSLVLSPNKQYLSCNNQQQDIAKNLITTRENSQHHNGMCQQQTANTNLHREQCSDYPLNNTIVEDETTTDENSHAQILLDASSDKPSLQLDNNHIGKPPDKTEIQKIIKDIEIDINTNDAIIVSNNDVDKSSEQQLVSNDSPIAISAINIKQDSISSHYDLDLRPFARGKFAQVKRCVHKDSQQEYAAKCIKKRRRLVDIRHEIMHEIQVLSLANVTSRIIKLHEVYETSNEIILVLEMAEGGELQRVLDDEEAIDEIHVQRMVKQILEGLFYLHKHDIAHLDIKPQNLLLTKKFPDGDIKLCDFGISRHIRKGAEIREICGTPDYVAPEILRYDPISLATDMWSLGVLTYALLSGYSPFGNENKQLTYCNITTANLDFPNECFSNVSSDAIDFIQKLVVKEPTERLTCREALEHRWIKSVPN